MSEWAKEHEENTGAVEEVVEEEVAEVEEIEEEAEEAEEAEVEEEAVAVEVGPVAVIE